MNFATLVDRVRADFVEMPGLELTLPQAVRLWNVGVDDCQHVLDALTDAGFLRWTPRRTVIRTGRAPSMRVEREPAYVSVRQPRLGDKSVV
jgi:hypothetical protein